MTEDGLYKIINPKGRREPSDYFTARAEELKASFARAQASTFHYGELGRELESCVRSLLSEYLPNRYDIATGFVRSLERPGWQSNQIDILLSRSDICYPIAVHQQYNVYPLESVISFMEVTSNLTKGKLREDYEKVAELQRQHKRLYAIPDPPVGVALYPAYNATHPRFYYFAFESSTRDQNRIAENMLELSNQYHIQLHALFVLKPGWCFIMPNAVLDSDRPYQTVILKNTLPNSLISFLEHILVSLQTADFIPQNASIPFSLYFDKQFVLPQLKKTRRKRITVKRRKYKWETMRHRYRKTTKRDHRKDDA